MMVYLCLLLIFFCSSIICLFALYEIQGQQRKKRGNPWRRWWLVWFVRMIGSSNLLLDATRNWRNYQSIRSPNKFHPIQFNRQKRRCSIPVTVTATLRTDGVVYSPLLFNFITNNETTDIYHGRVAANNRRRERDIKMDDDNSMKTQQDIYCSLKDGTTVW